MARELLKSPEVGGVKKLFYLDIINNGNNCNFYYSNLGGEL